MTSAAQRELIISRLPWEGPSLESSRRTVERLPDSLLNETATKLATAAALGTAHELRLIGELLGRADGDFSCEPFPDSATCDALLEVHGEPIGLEIAAHVAPAFATAIRRVCARVEAWLAESFVGHAYELDIGNLLAEFPLDERGRLHEDVLAEAMILEAELKIGRLDSSAGVLESFDSGGYISACRQAARNKVVQRGFSMPSEALQGQLQRIVDQKVTQPQWPGNTPGILAVVLHSYPLPGTLELYDILGPAFAKEPTLAAIVEIPVALNARPILILRPDGGLLGEREVAQIRSAFDFAYQREGDNVIE